MSARLAALYRLRDRVDAAILAEGGRVRRRRMLAPAGTVRPVDEPDPEGVLLEPEPPVSERAIIEAVLEHYSLSEAVLRTGKHREACDARQVAWLALRWEGYSTVQIGRLFQRDHSSVSSGALRAERLPALRDAARAVQTAAQNNFARTA